MTVFDFVLLGIILAYTAYILFGRKKKGCCGDCSGCTGCNRNNCG